MIEPNRNKSRAKRPARKPSNGKRRRRPQAEAKAAAGGPDEYRHLRRRVMGRLLKGEPHGHIAEIEDVSKRFVADHQRQLDEVGVGPDDDFLTPAQACVPMCLNPRRARWYCEEGRIGKRVAGKVWLIPRDELLQFLDREHVTGQAGRAMAERERKQEIS